VSALLSIPSVDPETSAAVVGVTCIASVEAMNVYRRPPYTHTSFRHAIWQEVERKGQKQAKKSHHCLLKSMALLTAYAANGSGSDKGFLLSAQFKKEMSSMWEIG
jgi:hypothetical protein